MADVSREILNMFCLRFAKIHGTYFKERHALHSFNSFNPHLDEIQRYIAKLVNATVIGLSDIKLKKEFLSMN